LLFLKGIIMTSMQMLAEGMFSWWQGLLVVLLILVIVFYVMYRRRQM